MIFTFRLGNTNGFDIVRMSDDLSDFLIGRDVLEQIAKEYQDGRQTGLFNFLFSLGVSSESFGDNVHFIKNVPENILKDVMMEHGVEMEEERIYN